MAETTGECAHVRIAVSRYRNVLNSCEFFEAALQKPLSENWEHCFEAALALRSSLLPAAEHVRNMGGLLLIGGEF